VIGKQVNRTSQQSAEAAVCSSSATESAHDSPSLDDFDRVVYARHLIHDWQSSSVMTVPKSYKVEAGDQAELGPNPDIFIE